MIRAPIHRHIPEMYRYILVPRNPAAYNYVCIVTFANQSARSREDLIDI